MLTLCCIDLSPSGHALDDDCAEDMDEPPDLVDSSDDERSTEDSDHEDVVAALYNTLAGRDSRDAEDDLLELDDLLRQHWSSLDEFPDPQTFTKEEAQSQDDGIPLLVLQGLDPGDLRHIFTESELRLYELGLKHAWTVEELKDLVRLLKDPTFQADDISPGLHEKFQELIKVQVLTL